MTLFTNKYLRVLSIQHLTAIDFRKNIVYLFIQTIIYDHIENWKWVELLNNFTNKLFKLSVLIKKRTFKLSEEDPPHINSQRHYEGPYNLYSCKGPHSIIHASSSELQSRVCLEDSHVLENRMPMSWSSKSQARVYLEA